MRFPFDRLALENHLQALQIALLRSGGGAPTRRAVASAVEQPVQKFGRALFGIDTPPALVVVSGLKLKGASLSGPEGGSLYAISITDQSVLGDPLRLASAANAAHEVVVRGDPRQIAGYVRQRSASSVLEEVGRISSGVRDQLLLLKPKIGLPGGISIQLG